MAKFLFLMLGLPGEPTAGDDQTQAYNRKWGTYMGSLAQRGALESGAPLPIQDRAPDQLAALLYTGGTTGRSKGVALSHANLSHAGESSRRISHVAGLNRGISALPLSHSFGMNSLIESERR